MAAHLFKFLKCTSPDSVRYMPLCSLITSIPRKRSNPSNRLSTTRTSTIMGQTCSRPNLILLYPQHFRVLPSAVNTPTSFCLHHRHTGLLTSVCEHPESTRAMHSRLLTNRFIADNFRFFTCSGRRLALMPSHLSVFSWNSNEMCPIPSHQKHHFLWPNFCTLSDPSGCTLVQFLTIRLGPLVADNCAIAWFSKENFCI